MEIADKEFAQSKREYLRLTGRKPKGDILAYQIRQSFKPGEIAPKEANRIGYETAMRFTKGNHAFVVATHIDRAHIHNHIIFNSTNLSCDRKFRNYWFIALALQKLSDLICLENGLSVIEPRKPSEWVKRAIP
ncbi:MAG: relaxase/mobilization nuclease domain-containing protein [Eubacteriales bacterium]